jgi:Arc/MetJ-type ribon-helix-helix transcriptional regulator
MPEHPEAPPAAPPVRFQIILSADTVERIDRLKERLDYSSRADVLRAAVRVLDLGLQDGNEIWVKDRTGREYRILLG